MAPQTRSSTHEKTRQVAAEQESREPSVLPASSDQDEMRSEDSETEAAQPKRGKRVRKDRQNSESLAQPPAKRARGKQGKLKGLMNMPIEVFTEIAKYLYPLDLILLSRANKFFRGLLMRRSGAQTWRYALSNVPGLPLCPEELCEPQYAALMFSKHCSMCGKQALRPMDPELLVRLCASCRDEETTYPRSDERGAVPTSSTLLPQKGRQRHWCCLRRDLDAYRRDYDAIRQADGHEAALRWTENRKREINDRWRNAQPLVEFIRKIEAEQSGDLATRKMQRQEEIESRLLKLDWEEGDLKMREKSKMKQWKSLVCIAKPLTERDWDKILPQLTSLLEANRKLRLENEAYSRRSNRQSKTFQWLSRTLRELGSYAEVLDTSLGDDTGLSAPKSGSTQAQQKLYSMINYSEESQRKNRNLMVPYPNTGRVSTWSPFQLLLDTDVPVEDFELALDGMRPTLDTLILEWRENLEKTLVKLLPSDGDVVPRDHQMTLGLEMAATSNPILAPTILVNGAPISSVPPETRRLLGADVVFSQLSALCLYPDDFASSWADDSKWEYNEQASKIASVLLASLGNIGATYLQMKATGPTFSCGRCIGCNCVTWRDMLSHYVSEYERRDLFQKHNSFKTDAATYIFTHDIEATQDGKLLVRVANEDDMKRPYQNTYTKAYCSICPSIVGRFGFATKTDAIDHVQNVHSIQEPEKGQHYRIW